MLGHDWAGQHLTQRSTRVMSHMMRPSTEFLRNPSTALRNNILRFLAEAWTFGEGLLYSVFLHSPTHVSTHRWLCAAQTVSR